MMDKIFKIQMIQFDISGLIFDDVRRLIELDMDEILLDERLNLVTQDRWFKIQMIHSLMLIELDRYKILLNQVIHYD